jgi:myo-inositol-1(or 4)-monophosphatase
MEESGAIEGADKSHRWIVDPLDGTTNFLHGIPIYNISIGLEREGQLVAGVVYNPAMDEMYTAEKGKGAFLNDKRLRVAGRKSLMECVISTGSPTSTTKVHDAFLAEVRTVMNQVASFRRFGAAALDLCYVASGRLDGFWERNLHPWDMAAGILMIREAGGFVTDLAGGSDMFGTMSVVAGNAFVHKSLLGLVGDKTAA